ncbi:hypothetical protein RZV07_001047 [Campylobacter coli]|nr:hypothetical protein [Campylobacter coli]
MSIFSINDNSNYGSILSQAKASKESKENSKISFANAFLKQNASKLNEIQSANSQTLIRSESLNNNLNSNFDTNYGLFSDFQNTVHTLKYKQADLNNTSSLAYGYSVDKNGYMGSDFNKAAGLPEDFKIHKSTLDEIERVAENNFYDTKTKEYLGVDKYYDNIDMAETIKQYYNLFSNALSQSFPNDKTSFSEADLEQLPKGLNYGRNENKEKIVKNIFNAEQFHEAQAIKYSTMNLGMNLMKLDFSPQSMEQDPSIEGEFNPDMSVYPQNEDGSYSKEALFMSFLKSYPPFPSSNQVVFSPEAKVREAKLELEMKANPSFSVSLDDIMTGKVDFASLLKGYAQDGWLDAGIYAMEKGVKWQNVYVGSGISFDREFHQAKANGWKASSESINSFADSIADRLNNLIGQTRV